MKKLKPTPTYQAPALDKGLDILECLAASRVPQTRSQIAALLGRGPSEVFRMLVRLEQRGYLERDPVSGAYSLTLRLHELSHTHSPHQRVAQTALRPMRELAENTRESCHLSVLYRGRVLVLQQEESPDEVRLSVERGSTIAPIYSVSGRLLLAFSADAEVQEILKVDPDYQRYTREQNEAFTRRLRDIARRGFEEAYSETIEGVYDVAALLGSPHSTVRMALAVASLTREGRRTVRERLLRPLQECAAHITQVSGLSPLAASSKAVGE